MKRNDAKLSSIFFLVSLISSIFPEHLHVCSAKIECFVSSSAKPRASTFFQRKRIELFNAASIEEESQASSSSAIEADRIHAATKRKTAPVLISIGPPCANKKHALELYLSSQGYMDDDGEASTYRDINLRDQSEGVYHRIPMAAFIYPTTRLTDKIGSEILYSDVTVRDRLFDPDYDSTDSEIRSVILRLAGRMTPDEFAERVREQALKAGDTVEYFKRRRMEISEDLIRAVEEVSAEAIGEVLVQMQLKMDQEALMAEDELPYDDEADQQEAPVDLTAVTATSAHLLSAKALIKTPYVEIYVPQCILYEGGVDRAEKLLGKLLLEDSTFTPMAWENTNTRPSEYAVALLAAEKAKRPVKFISWGTQWMPRISRKDLLKRNVIKFRQTGRYIPAGALGGALDRVENMVQMAEEEANKIKEVVENNSESEKHMNAAFASLGGFEMKVDGTVEQNGECKQLRPPFRSRRRRNNRNVPREKR